jgi:hypothetical protein
LQWVAWSVLLLSWEAVGAIRVARGKQADAEDDEAAKN